MTEDPYSQSDEDFYNQFDEGPYSQFDPYVAAALKAAFDAELNQRLRPFDQDREDRAFAESERRMRAIYPEYDAQRADVLRFAIDNQMPDLDLAYRAWRGSQAPVAESQTITPGVESADDKIQRRDARIEELRHLDDHASRMEKSKLEHERDEDRDARALRLVKDANGEDRFRQDALHDSNTARDQRNSERTMRALLGRPEERAPSKSKEEKYAEMDLAAIDLFRTGKLPKKTPEPARDRSAEYAAAKMHLGEDARDHAVLDSVHRANEPEQS